MISSYSFESDAAIIASETRWLIEESKGGVEEGIKLAAFGGERVPL